MKGVPPSFLTRRRFLVAGTSALLFSGRAWAESTVAVPPLGTCGSIDQAKEGRAAGLSFVEIGLAPNCGPSVSDEAFEKWLEVVRNAPLPASRANVFFSGDFKLVGPKRDLAKIKDYTDATLSRAAKAGVKIITLGSGGARRAPDGTPIPEAIEQFTECCRAIAPIGQRHGITISVEPLNRGETNLLNRLSDVCAVVDAVNSPNLGATADLYHMLREGEGADALVAAGKRLRQCHIAEHKDRRAPGVGGEDFSPYFAALQSINYQGGISIECSWTDFSTELPKAVATISNQWRSAASKPSSND